MRETTMWNGRLAIAAAALAAMCFGAGAAYADEHAAPAAEALVEAGAVFEGPGDAVDGADGQAPEAGDGNLPAEPLQQGWNYREGLWYWAESQGDRAATGWLFLDGRWYWLDPEAGGAMATGAFEAYGHRYAADASGVVIMDGWGLHEGTWYYADASGVLRTGWAYAGGSWYWFDRETGAMAHDTWLDEGGSRFYLASDGTMATGWVFVDGGWYLLSRSGALYSGWICIEGSWYWLDPEAGGLLATGLFDVDGFRYCAPQGGVVAVDGWCFFEGRWYYADGSGALERGWLNAGGDTYWLDPETGAMATGFIDQDGALYWFDETGALAKGSVVVDGALRFADETGAVRFDASGWQSVDGRKYYAGDDGVLVTGWFEDQGETYCFDEHGVMDTEWMLRDGVWYWLGADGAVKTGWQYIGGYWFYFDEETAAMAVGWREVDGAMYKFDAAGFMQTGWIAEGGSWYYCRGDGSMATGWQWIGGAWYWLDPETGAMATGWLHLDDGWYWLRDWGAMATGWINEGGSAYKLDAGGRWVENTGSVLGVSRTRLVEWLWSHENDWYYWGTPYSNGLSVDTCMYPNGSPRWDGFVGMNCTGFVAHAYAMAGGVGDLDAIGRTQSYSPWPTGPGRGGYVNAWRWYGYAVERGVEMCTFDSVASMLASGKADKGDIIFFKTNGSIDCHIGFFWGDTPYENRMWHQIYPQNCISACFNNANRSELYQQTVLIKGCW